MHSIIDAHIHLSSRKDDSLIPYARRNGLVYSLPELLRLMKENGVARGILLSPPKTPETLLPNEEVIGLCRKSGGVLSPVLTVTPTARGIAAAVSMARRNRMAVRGFKVLLGYFRVFADDRRFNGLYDYAEEEGLPVMFHTGDTAESGGSLVHSQPLTLDALANARPRLMVVACHFGNPWIEDVGELIYKHQNVYADISGLAVGGGRYSERYAQWLTRKLSDAIHFAGGADKVLFGTDYPVTSYRAALGIVAKLEVNDEDREGILWRNAEKVFSL